MSDELKPCPFCGEEARLSTWRDETRRAGHNEAGFARVGCTECDCEGGDWEDDDKPADELAVEHWNMRPGEAALAKRVREAGMAVLESERVSIERLQSDATPGADDEDVDTDDLIRRVERYGTCARALLAMLEAAKEPT